MKNATLFLFTLFVIQSGWSQVQPTATGDMGPIDEDTRMPIPPIANGMLYPNMAAGAERSNYFRAAVTTSAGYIDNLVPAAVTAPVSSSTVSVLPTFSFEKTVPRVTETFTYSPSFTFYQNASGLNAFDQSATGHVEARLSPHITLGLHDTFVRTSNVFNTGYPFAAGGLAGTTQAPVPALIVPFAEQVRNDSNAGLSYQFSSKGMIGGGASVSNYRYPNKIQAPGLFDSDGYDGSVFYNRRLSQTQYIGMMYSYDRTSSYATTDNVETTVNSFLPFYTVVLAHRFSLSVAGGAESLHVHEHLQPEFNSWSPKAVVSFGWQNEKADIAASYLHSVIAGQGLLGAYKSNGLNFDGGLKFSRTITARASLAYEVIDTATTLTALNYAGGNTTTASTSLEKTFGEHVAVSLGYDRLHEVYKGIAVIDANPDSNREFVTVTYNLTKSLGR